MEDWGIIKEIDIFIVFAISRFPSHFLLELFTGKFQQQNWQNVCPGQAENW